MSQGTQQEIMFNQQNVFESGKKLVNHQKRLWIIFFNDFSVILIIMFYNKWWLFTKCSSTFQFSLNLIFLQFYYHLFACFFPLTFPILWWLKNFACEFTTIMILCHQFIFNSNSSYSEAPHFSHTHHLWSYRDVPPFGLVFCKKSLDMGLFFQISPGFA